MSPSRAPTELPDGFRYIPDAVDEDEERTLIALLDSTEFHDVTMRGQTARRTVRHYGYDYDYENWRVTPTEPIPDELAWLRERCASFAELHAGDLAEALLTRYPPGATIGWHRDAPMFGAKVIGVSLLAGCRMRFQRGSGAERRVFDQDLAARSAYVISGASRSSWQHSIPPVKQLRYSITFRTLRAKARAATSRP